MSEQKPPKDPFEMFRRLWGPLGCRCRHGDADARPARARQAAFADLARSRLGFNMNLNMVKFSIQGLELQRARCSYALCDRTCQRPQHKRKNEMPKAVRFHKTGGPTCCSSTRCRSASGPGQARVRHTAIGSTSSHLPALGLYPIPLPGGAQHGAGVRAVGPNFTT